MSDKKDGRKHIAIDAEIHSIMKRIFDKKGVSMVFQAETALKEYFIKYYPEYAKKLIQEEEAPQ